MSIGYTGDILHLRLAFSVEGTDVELGIFYTQFEMGVRRLGGTWLAVTREVVE